MTQLPPIVYIVDDDDSVRKALARLLEAEGFWVEPFATADDFVAHRRPPNPACLVLDIRMPGMSGLDLQRRLTSANPELPIVVVTGHGDGGMREQALRSGAVAYLEKPFDDRSLLEAVDKAFAIQKA